MLETTLDRMVRKSVEETLIDMYLACVSTRQVDRVPAAVGRPHALADPGRQAQEGLRRHRRMAGEASGTGVRVPVHGRRMAQALPGRPRGERGRCRPVRR